MKIHVTGKVYIVYERAELWYEENDDEDFDTTTTVHKIFDSEESAKKYVLDNPPRDDGEDHYEMFYRVYKEVEK